MSTAKPPGDNRRFVPRFAGEAFLHQGQEDGPMLRKLVSTIDWKRPPSSKISSEVST
jgi:hypothetical protein